MQSLNMHIILYCILYF